MIVLKQERPRKVYVSGCIDEIYAKQVHVC